LVLFPNPVQHALFITGANYGEAYQIQNGLGQIVLEGSLDNSIDVTNLSEGIYVVKINGQALTFIK
jgi:hypothetical protein